MHVSVANAHHHRHNRSPIDGLQYFAGYIAEASATCRLVAISPSGESTKPVPRILGNSGGCPEGGASTNFWMKATIPGFTRVRYTSGSVIVHQYG